ncbi:hypothetical protein [Streptomyces parvulus]|uniref:hypothetical protein n=1 Tax=Streptomyces parvulus TaxID=146923 RepID=UPI0033AECA7B
MRSRGMKAGAIGTAAVMASVVLAGCGGDSDPKTEGKGDQGKDAAASASASDAGSGGGGQGQDTKAVRAAYDKTAEAGSARMTIDMKLTAGEQRIATDGEGTLDLAEGNSVMTVMAENKKIEQRVVDQVLYQKIPGQEAGGKPWIKIDLKKVAQQQGLGNQQIGDPAQTAAYAKAITDKDVSKVGTEKIDGADTTHYRVSVDVAELPGGEMMRQQLGPTLPMQVWLDDDGRLRRQQIDMTVKAPASASAKPEGGSAPKELKMSTVMNFSDFGTEVDAEAPPAGEVTDMTEQALQGSGQQG